MLSTVGTSLLGIAFWAVAARTYTTNDVGLASAEISAMILLGNLAQLQQITALADEGVALYDLGSEVDYKRRWGEDCLETLTIVAIPRALRVRRARPV